MFRRNYSLVLLGVWLVVAAMLLVPEWSVAERFRQATNLGGPQGTLLGVLALVLAGYNLARWWQIRTIYRLRGEARGKPFRVRTVREDVPYEHNPELDFFKPAEADKPPEPSANGDQKVG